MKVHYQLGPGLLESVYVAALAYELRKLNLNVRVEVGLPVAVSYTHLRAHETVLDIVCRLLLEKKKNTLTNNINRIAHIE